MGGQVEMEAKCEMNSLIVNLCISLALPHATHDPNL